MNDLFTEGKDDASMEVIGILPDNKLSGMICFINRIQTVKIYSDRAEAASSQ